MKIDVVAMLHDLCKVKMMNGLDVQSFVDLLQQCGEEQGLMSLQNEEFDEFVPTVVIKEFVKEFFKGFSILMNEIGFNQQ